MNPIRSILVHLDTSAPCPARLRLAQELAQRFDAGATALFAASAAEVLMPFGDTPEYSMAAVHAEFEADGRDAGDLLLSEAAARSADLLVMGCYGHARAREWMLGGASHTLTRSKAAPQPRCITDRCAASRSRGTAPRRASCAGSPRRWCRRCRA